MGHLYHGYVSHNQSVSMDDHRSDLDDAVAQRDGTVSESRFQHTSLSFGHGKAFWRIMYIYNIHIISSSIVNVDDQEGDAAATLATPIGDEAATATLAFVFFCTGKPSGKLT